MVINCDTLRKIMYAHRRGYLALFTTSNARYTCILHNNTSLHCINIIQLNIFKSKHIHLRHECKKKKNVHKSSFPSIPSVASSTAQGTVTAAENSFPIYTAHVQKRRLTSLSLRLKRDIQLTKLQIEGPHRKQLRHIQRLSISIWHQVCCIAKW